MVILIKSTLFNWVMYFSFANIFFPSKFPHIQQCLSRFVQWQRHAIAILKSVKQKSNFSQAFEWQEILKRKTNKSYDKTAVRNDPGNNTKKIVNLILENALPKAIIEVYFELSTLRFPAVVIQSLWKLFPSSCIV